MLEEAYADADAAAHADALAAVASTSGGTDEEAKGLQLMAQAAAIDPGLFHRHGPAMRFLLAGLHYGQACSLGTAHELSAAIHEYAIAAVPYAESGLSGPAEHCLDRVQTSATDNTDSATAAIVAFADHALGLERLLGAKASVTIADTLRLASATLDGPIARDLLIARDQVAKGLRFAAALTSPSPVALDDPALRLLDHVHHLESQGSDDEVAGVAASALDDEDMLASFVAPTEATPGRTVDEQLVNVRRRFDEHLATSRIWSKERLVGRSGL